MSDRVAAGADSVRAAQAESSEGGGAVTAILVVGRYIRGTLTAVNRRYVTPEVGWLVGLRGGKRSS